MNCVGTACASLLKYFRTGARLNLREKNTDLYYFWKQNKKKKNKNEIELQKKKTHKCFPWHTKEGDFSSEYTSASAQVKNGKTPMNTALIWEADPRVGKWMRSHHMRGQYSRYIPQGSTHIMFPTLVMDINTPSTPSGSLRPTHDPSVEKCDIK